MTEYGLCNVRRSDCAAVMGTVRTWTMYYVGMAIGDIGTERRYGCDW